MSTRAIQIELLLDGITNPTTGEVVDSGTVYFYAAGTTDAKNVWTEKEKTNAYTSYTLNGIGGIQLYGEGNYKIVIKDSNDSTVVTYDNIRLKYPNYYVHDISSNYTQDGDDDYLRVDTTSGNITITCAAAADWEQPLKVKKVTGSNNIIIDPNGSETIDGSATLTITSDAVVEIVSDGSNLETVGFVGTFEDTDGDTKIQVEESADEDVIRFDTGGVERAKIDSTATDVDNLSIGGTLVTATADEINTTTDGLFLASLFVLRPKFEDNGGSTAYTINIPPGYYYVQNKVAQWKGTITTTAIGTPSADTWYYLYLDYSAITSMTAITNSELTWSTTAPTYNTTYAGWYNGSDRCIFAVLTNSGPTNITPFIHDGDMVFWETERAEASAITPSNSWTDVDMSSSIPGFATRAVCSILADQGATGDDTYFEWRRNGGGSHIIGRVDDDTPLVYATTPVITDGSQIIEVRFNSASSDNALTVNNNAWFLPIGL
jgi:hypothetical protein